ncbi:hypothetical protein DyAD56_01875 [Dyella sp. AD56]|uniref:hypothetical protein n=1 Tax=Dyella sp. AD56 TaxID=1528744 RepID=UPI000C860C39|nr:hypothetical protein [Dyella sp. AD56]PMQ07499.1 hypothetical protein DyAD56_01875 [Dyella sp. AD56]
MQQFIPFEDEWDILDRLSPEDLIPYHVGVPCRHDLAANDHHAEPAAPTFTTRAPMHATIPPRRSGT